MNIDGDALAALRALRDLGTVRAPLDHPGYRILRMRRLASFWWVQGNPDPIHRLTPRGKTIAEEIL